VEWKGPTHLSHLSRPRFRHRQLLLTAVAVVFGTPKVLHGAQKYIDSAPAALTAHAGPSHPLIRAWDHLVNQWGVSSSPDRGARQSGSKSLSPLVNGKVYLTTMPSRSTRPLLGSLYSISTVTRVRDVRATHVRPRRFRPRALYRTLGNRHETVILVIPLLPEPKRI
jgi:hypothetical protein